MSPDLSTPSDLDAARKALRLRQGLGARYDAANAPARELGWARRGAAYFARKLHELADDELRAPSLVAGWSRQHIAAWVGYQARALARLTQRVRTDADLRMAACPGQRAEEIADGATLPPGALRHLVTHAEIHLNVEWRDLSVEDWDWPLNGNDGEPSTVRETAWLRAREIWLQAVNLGNGGTLRDAPEDFLRALIEDRLRLLNDKEPSPRASARHGTGTVVVLDGQQIAGSLHAIADWLCGAAAPPGNAPDDTARQLVDALGPAARTAESTPFERKKSYG